MGVDVVFPMHSGRKFDFKNGKRLGKKDHLVQWKKPKKPKWMDEETYAKYPEKITMREVAVSSNRAEFRSQTRVMVTTFLDPKKVSKNDLGLLYNFRWLVEINLRAIKETMRMDILRCKTPAMIRKEIWVHLLAYNLIRKIIAQAALKYGGKKPCIFQSIRSLIPV